MRRDSWLTEAATTYPRRHDRILWRDVDDCVVLFSEEDGRAFALNETAACVWKLSDGSRSVQDVAELLGAARDPAGASALDAAADALAALDAFGCIVASPTARPSTGLESPSPAAEWRPPVVEEIAFGACDCSGGGRGVVRNAACNATTPKQQQSTI